MLPGICWYLLALQGTKLLSSPNVNCEWNRGIVFWPQRWTAVHVLHWSIRTFFFLQATRQKFGALDKLSAHSNELILKRLLRSHLMIERTEDIVKCLRHPLSPVCGKPTVGLRWRHLCEIWGFNVEHAGKHSDVSLLLEIRRAQALTLKFTFTVPRTAVLRNGEWRSPDMCTFFLPRFGWRWSPGCCWRRSIW